MTDVKPTLRPIGTIFKEWFDWADGCTEPPHETTWKVVGHVEYRSEGLNIPVYKWGEEIARA